MSNFRKLVGGMLSILSTFVGGGQTSAVQSGKWKTDFAIICDNGRKKDTENIIRNMCNHEFTIYNDDNLSNDSGKNSYEFGAELNPNDLQAVIHDKRLGEGGDLNVQYHILELNDLSSWGTKDLIQKCAGVIIFYDLKDPRFKKIGEISEEKFYETSNDPITVGIKFLGGFDWNNYVDFANYCTDYDEYNKISRYEHKDKMLCNNDTLVRLYHGYFEYNKAYERELYKCGKGHVHNNRWGRTFCGLDRLLLRSSRQAFDMGMYVDPIGFEKKYAHRLGEEPKDDSSQKSESNWLKKLLVGFGGLTVAGFVARQNFLKKDAKNELQNETKTPN